MLLPSALACDVVQTSRNPGRAPFYSPLSSSSPTLVNIYNTCRALQLILSPSASLQEPTPFLPPTRENLPGLRICSQMPTSSKARKRKHSVFVPPQHKVTKRTIPFTRHSRRQRTHEHKFSFNNNEPSPHPMHGLGTPFEQSRTPTTPIRALPEPQMMSSGIEQKDFQTLESQNDQVMKQIRTSTHLDEVTQWSNEEDRILIQFVLQKLKLSKDDWDACACILGRHSKSVGRRWKSLMVQGRVGLKNGFRVRKPSTWK
ncbi:hypothetical protein K3495_g7203 [Podosphaera aphanis]|nr:hypothetical protein K3495_g7203 [Podosphaera aphanis]